MKEIIIIMGVSGVGKSTIGAALATELALPFLEGDDYHPKSNIEKMKSGEALNDEDRWPWLTALCAQLNELPTSGVASCSALKNSYRKFIEQHCQKKIRWVWLKLDVETIKARMQARSHFMPSALLDSQFATLEEPTIEEAIIIDNDQDLPELIDEIVLHLPSEFGIIGLGVMGKSLARNMVGNGVRLSMLNFNFPPNEMDVAKKFQAEFNELKKAKPFDQLEAFVQSLATPRRILLMVKAGKAVDGIVSGLQILLDKEDIIIDAGNSHFKDTQRRIERCGKIGIHYLGMGVSGGEKGALEGPSMMPSGPELAYEAVAPVLLRMAAKHTDGQACCAYLGSGGAGHFIKMVHNGIEYAEMQLLAEIGSLLQYRLGFSHESISELFAKWNEGTLRSYLLEISSKIYAHKEGEGYLLDRILDKAGNKGTGNWTTVAASELGVAIPGLTAALFARYTSAYKKQRTQLAQKIQIKPQEAVDNLSLEDLATAYQFARLMNFEQGLQLLSAASAEHGWNISLSEVARIWRAGCILRSTLVEELAIELKTQTSIFDSAKLLNLLQSSRASCKKVCQYMLEVEHAAPCFQADYQYFLNRTEAQSSANLIQAQRDFFGAHRYQRNDRDGEDFFHTNWESNS